MNDHCTWVRDDLPDLAGGRVDAARERELRAHVAECGECAVELDLIRTLRADAITVPPGLETRIRAARRARDAAGRRAWLTPGRLAMAATVVLALVTATLLDGPREPLSSGSDVAGTGEGDALSLPAWPAADEPLLRGGPALDQLSVEELESLLRELDW